MLRGSLNIFCIWAGTNGRFVKKPFTFYTNTLKMPMVGGTGDVKDADENVHRIASEIKDEVQSKTGLAFEEFTPIKFKTQLVNGVNYFIKVRHAPEQHMHVRVHKSFQGELTLAAYQLEKQLEDELEYFQ